jgi:hypothetical protein
MLLHRPHQALLPLSAFPGCPARRPATSVIPQAPRHGCPAWEPRHFGSAVGICATYYPKVLQSQMGRRPCNRGDGFVDLGVLARWPTGKICSHSLWPGSSRVPYRDTHTHRPLGPERKHSQTGLDFAQTSSGRKSRHGRHGRQRSAPPDQYRDPCGCLKGRGYRDGMGQTRSNVFGARSMRTYGRIYLAHPLRARALHT